MTHAPPLTPLRDAAAAARFGGKAAGLGVCLRAGLPVPDGFALSAADVADVVAGRMSLTTRIPAGRWAVRSSAVDEDGAGASFAGQHLTRLHVPAEALDDAVRDVAASADTPEAHAYRARMGRVPGAEGVGMAVVLQHMVDAAVSGVLFTRHPVTGARELVIESAWGLGEAVVAGVIIPDSYRLAPDGRLLEQRIGHKDLAARPGDDGHTHLRPVPAALMDASTLDTARLARLFALAERTMAACGPDLDIEWSFAADGALHLLQQRPLTA